MSQRKTVSLNFDLISILDKRKDNSNKSYNDVIFSALQSPSTTPTGNTSVIGVGAGTDAYNTYSHVLRWVSDTSKKLIQSDQNGEHTITPSMREQAYDIDPMVNGIVVPTLKNMILNDHILETKDNKKYATMIEDIEKYLKDIKLMKVFRDDFEDTIKHGHSYRRIDLEREGYIKKLQRLEARAMLTYEDPFDSDIVLYHQRIYATDIFSSVTTTTNQEINSWWIPDGLTINEDAKIYEDGAKEIWQQYVDRYSINETARLRVGDSADIIAMHRVRPGKPAPIDSIIQAIWEKRALIANIPNVIYNVLYPLVQVIQGTLYESADEMGNKVLRSTVPYPPDANDATNDPEKYARMNSEYNAYTSALDTNVKNLLRYQMEGGKIGTGPDVQLKVIESASQVASSFINVAMTQFNEEICQGLGLPYSLITARGSELATSRAIQDLVNTVYSGQRLDYQDIADWIIEQRFAGQSWNYELTDKYGEIDKGTFTFEETKVKFKLSNGDVTDNLKIAQTELINFQSAQIAKAIGAGKADIQAFFSEKEQGIWDLDNFDVKPEAFNQWNQMPKDKGDINTAELPAIGKLALPSDAKAPSVSEQIASSTPTGITKDKFDITAPEVIPKKQDKQLADDLLEAYRACEAELKNADFKE